MRTNTRELFATLANEADLIIKLGLILHDLEVATFDFAGSLFIAF